jgi:methyl-accepting chemotaxis protein
VNSATTEVLARASSAMADTVDEVAVQTAETRDSLERAKADLADQTNLLALNAAILDGVREATDAAGQVRLTTQQQRSATSQQIAAAVGNLADLAANLETTAATTRDRY